MPGIFIGNSIVQDGATLNLPNLPEANADIIQYNSINALDTSGSLYYNTSVANDDGYEFFDKLKSDRIFQTGTISKLKINVKTLTANIDKVLINTWRFNGTTYDRISSQNIRSLLAVGDNYIVLPTAINAIEGDWISIALHSVETNLIQFGYASTHTALCAYNNGSVTNPFAWDAAPTVNVIQHIHLFGVAPLIIGIGDSIMGGYPATSSLVDSGVTAFDPSKSWLYKLKGLNSKFTYQNKGIASLHTESIAGDFTRDVIPQKPVFVAIDGGLNDITLGRTKAQFLEQWTIMLNYCVTNSIIPIVWKIMPCTYLNNTQHATRLDWNADLVTLFNTYSTLPVKIIIDWDADLGQFKTGGDANNLWDLKTEYAADTKHLNEDGNAKVAAVVLAEISKIYKV